jgi:hypothetical protein
VRQSATDTGGLRSVATGPRPRLGADGVAPSRGQKNRWPIPESLDDRAPSRSPIERPAEAAHSECWDGTFSRIGFGLPVPSRRRVFSPVRAGARGHRLGRRMASGGTAGCRSASRVRAALREDAINTQRNPLLSLRLSGLLLLRFDESRFLDSLLFQDPPRRTRARPPVSPPKPGIEWPAGVSPQQPSAVTLPGERIPGCDALGHGMPGHCAAKEPMSPPFKTPLGRPQNAGPQTGNEAESAEGNPLPRGQYPTLWHGQTQTHLCQFSDHDPRHIVQYGL